MFNEQKAKFLFRCEECQMIISIDLEEEKDIQDVNDNKMVMDCKCGGICLILRD